MTNQTENMTIEFDAGSILYVLDGDQNPDRIWVAIGMPNKGWVALQDEDGNTKKVRGKQLTEVGRVAEDGTFALANAPGATTDDATTNVEDEDEDEDEDAGGYRMSSHIQRFIHRYETATNARGNKTKVCGDELANTLLALTPEETVNLTANLLGDDYRTKYSHLNPGQQRMNCGNVLRAKIRKGELTIRDGKIVAA